MNGKCKVIASILLVMGVLITLNGGAAAYGPKMDNDLAFAYASFIGEEDRNYAGRGVSIVGDVNGDGYDDILIGAHYNAEGAEQAGQTYLVFGKTTGWSSSFNLSGSDASFLGEVYKDWSGQVVKGAGDVNNDGYDDMLIGAPSLGLDKAYLIFGKESGWTMDTSLSAADVKFTSEGHDPRTGWSVSGAGDVNGDGFDDILVGAPFTAGTGDKITGHTYLVLGRASGWSGEMDLTREADASFLGEDKDDDAGFSISGAGDVNGDGFDDIVIGAWKNAEAGEGTGQTYLIFGKETGWELDTWLSDADASFHGAARDDLTGYSVAGVGDVNGDGFDDILVGGYGVSDNGMLSGGAFLVLGKASGWMMDTNLSSADASFLGERSGDEAGLGVAYAGDVNDDGFDDFLVGASNNDDSHIDAGQVYLILGKPSGWAMGTSLADADASFLGERKQDYIGRSIAGGGDVNNDGHDDILIGATGNDEGGDEAGKVYLLLFDDEPPKIERDSSMTMATTGDPFTFNITASDNLRLANVTVEHWYGSLGPHSNSTAFQTSGDLLKATWRLVITVPSDSIHTLHYIIHVSDFAGLVTSTTPKDVTVRDNDPPVLIDQTPSRATTGDPFTLRVDAWDNIDLAEVSVEYWYGDTGSHTVMPLVQSLEDYWYHAVTVPSDSTEILHVTFGAIDETGNEATTAVSDVVVVDDDPPTMSSDGTPSTGTTGDPLSFSIEATDNVGVVDVTVEYWYGGSFRHANESMVEGPDGVWTLMVTVANDTVDDLHYLFSVKDIGSNWATSPVGVVEVEDDDTPVLVEDGSRPWAGTGEDYVVVVEVEENVGIRGVMLTYRVGGQSLVDIPMRGTDLGVTGSGTYEGTVPIPIDSVEPLVYSITITDSSDNSLTTEERTVEVQDLVEPYAVAGEDIHIDQGDTAILDGSGSTDNIGIIVWRWSFQHGDTELDLEGETVEYKFVYAGVYNITLYVSDEAGNDAIDTLELVVRDTEPPEPVDQGDIDAIKGEPVTFDGSQSTDNVGIVEWTWTVEYESGKREVIDGKTVEYTFDEAGDHTVTLTVRDAEGNEATGATFTVHVPSLMIWFVVILVVIAVIVTSVVVVKKRSNP